MDFGCRALAVTGGAGEGKSTVLSYLAEAGWKVVSADDISHRVWKDPGFSLALAELCGNGVQPSRAEVRRRVFSSPEFRRKLNALAHRPIVAAMLAEDADAYEVPLLFESALHPLFRRVWVVSCGEREQERRLTERLGDAEEARLLIASQMPTRAKCAFADRIVRTNLPEPDVRSYVLRVLAEDFGQ
ncbi:MAG: dephospho-CoA kinase [Armatimonadetes bacterium]|nr:dephospho-CoA kinase [Armatimonadota bacterium]